MFVQLQQKYAAGDEEVRRGIVQELRGFHLDEAAALLFEAMGDESWRVRKEAVSIFVAAQPEDRHIEAVVELFRNGENAGQRNSAAEAVTLIGSRACSALVSRLRDNDADVRKIVIDVLGSIGCYESIGLLRDSLNDPDINVAAAAAEQLGKQGDSSVVPSLLQAIVTNTNDFFRFNALAAIGKLAAPAPVPPQIVALANDDILRKATYECLGSIADQSACPLLLEGLSSRQKSSRHAALIALYRIYGRSSEQGRKDMADGLKALQGTEVVPLIMEAYSRSDQDRSEAVVALLDLIGDPRAIRIMLQAFTNQRTSQRALAFVKRMGPAIMLDVLSLYATVDETLRAAICLLCAECSHPLAAEKVRQALSDSSALVRQAAVTTIGKLGLIQALPEVTRLLDDADNDVRNAACACLQSFTLIDREDLTSVTAALAAADNAEHRRIAAVLAASLGDRDRLMLLVKDEHSSVRQAAVSALGSGPCTDVEGVLIMALVDEDPDVRIAAAEAMGESGSDAFVDTLLSAMADDDVWVQCAVLKSLTKLNRAAAFAVIQGLLATASGLLLLTCLQMLELLATPAALALVAPFVSHVDRDVAALASEIYARHTPPRDVA